MRGNFWLFWKTNLSKLDIAKRNVCTGFEVDWSNLRLLDHRYMFKNPESVSYYDWHLNTYTFSNKNFLINQILVAIVVLWTRLLYLSTLLSPPSRMDAFFSKTLWLNIYIFFIDMIDVLHISMLDIINGIKFKKYSKHLR